MHFNTVLTSLALAASAVLAKPILSTRAPAGNATNVNEDGVYVSCNRTGVFAMTFDDGPYQYSWDLAKYLNEQGIRSTFFINGNNWVNVESDTVTTSDGDKTYMEVIKHYYDMGHEVASHTYEHKVLTGLTKEEIEYQMNTQSDIIFKAIGKRPALMRPPTGAYDANSLAVLKELGYSVVNWDLDTNDWRAHDFTQEKSAYQEMDKDTPQTLGHITLEHEVYNQTVDELVPWAIDYLKTKGYQLVTASECVGVEPYQN
ncbi:Carbohydrate esterase 4 protein [Rhizopus azygosporus]|uniref:Carbohydrate esterase 4 protein n=1 Tax=Rhizopus azygosporus TaxID=86630 RepID=A0A367JD39_RHIAZ|nr:Carbohydrate esterase 4 protein [Rhizopus azygosporus]